MIVRLFWIVLVAALLTACATPTPLATLETQPTLPPPAAETAVPTPSASEAAPTLVAPAATRPAEVMPAVAPSAFSKMEVDVSGALLVDAAAGRLHFTDDFAISPGPDLFVILSGANDLSLDYVAFSQVVSDAPILYLGELVGTGGAQDYAIPAGTDLAQYNTLVIWCRQYSVAFAAASLR